MRLHRAPRAREARRGTAAVEFALVAPFLCFAFVATIDFARVYYCSLTVSNCARNGAIYGAADKTCAVDASGIQSAARLDASNLKSSQLGVSSTSDGSSYLEVRVTYPFQTLVTYPGIPHTTNISRTVRMNVVPATPTVQ
jgi:Flp pilus assembly protein TadG